jgi:hypothetical protein
MVFTGIDMPHLIYDKVEHDRLFNNTNHRRYIPFDDDVQLSRNGSLMTQGKCRMSSSGINALTYNVIVGAGIFVVVPFIVNFTCNCLMILQLFRRMVNAQVLGKSLASRAYRDVRMFTKRVIVISVTHCALTIPQVAFDIHMQTVDHGSDSDLHYINHALWHRIVTFLFYVNSFLNLILYYTTGSDFKLDVKDLLRPLIRGV